MNRYMKFLNIALIFAMLVLCMPVQAFAAAPEKLPVVRMTGGVTFDGQKYRPVGDAVFTVANAKARKPTSMTIIKGGRPMTTRLSWEGNSTRMYIPEGVEFLYFNIESETLTHRIIPQGQSRRVWQETYNQNSICPKRADGLHCDH